MTAPSPHDAPSAHAVSGKRLVVVFLGLLAFAFVAASAIFFAARPPGRPAPDLSRPGMTRDDVAGQALVQVLFTCLSETTLTSPVHLRLLVSVEPNGSAKLVDLTSNVDDGTLAPCARRAPTLVRTESAFSSPSHPLEVRFDSELDASGARTTKSGWSLSPRTDAPR